MNKTMLSLWAACLIAIVSTAQTNEQALKLTGIVSLPEMKCAFLEFNASGRYSRQVKVKLREGQREEGVEILKIDAGNGEVEVKSDGKQFLLRLEGAGQKSQTICFRGVTFQQVVDLYGEITGRNVLQSPLDRSLAMAGLSSNIEAQDGGQAALAFENIFLQQGLAVIPDGKKFVILVPTSSVSTVVAGSDKLTSTVDQSTGFSTPNQMISVGAINFMNAEVAQVVRLYEDLVGRKLNREESQLLGPPIHFRSVTRLSKVEAIYAVETLLKLDGLEIIPIGDKEFKVAPQSSERRIKDK